MRAVYAAASSIQRPNIEEGRIGYIDALKSIGIFPILLGYVTRFEPLVGFLHSFHVPTFLLSAEFSSRECRLRTSLGGSSGRCSFPFFSLWRFRRCVGLSSNDGFATIPLPFVGGGGRILHVGRIGSLLAERRALVPPSAIRCGDSLLLDECSHEPLSEGTVYVSCGYLSYRNGCCGNRESYRGSPGVHGRCHITRPGVVFAGPLFQAFAAERPFSEV